MTGADRPTAERASLLARMRALRAAAAPGPADGAPPEAHSRARPHPPPLSPPLSPPPAPPLSPPLSPPRAAPRPRAVAPGVTHERLPATATQERFWLLDQVTRGGGAHNVCRAWRLDGPLDAEALRGAFEALGDRHASLRTLFEDVGGRLMQTILAPGLVRPRLETRDLTGADDPEARAVALAAETLGAGFILSRAPLIRGLLARIGPDAHLFAFGLDHIICDGWSLEVLARDLSALYAERTGGPAAPPPPRLDMGDVALDEPRRLADPAAAAEIAHWRRKLADLPPFDLASDVGGGPGARTHLGGRAPMPGLAALTGPLRAFARAEGRTESAVLLAAMIALIDGQRRGQAGPDARARREVVAALPVAGRRGGDADVIGAFVNTTLVRVDLTDDPDFRTLTARVAAELVEALDHQTLPFERIAASEPLRDGASASDLISLAYTHFPGRLSPDLPGVAARSIRLDSGAARFALSFNFTENEDGLRGELEHDAGWFSAEAARAMAARFPALLAAAVADPGTRISALPRMTPAELEAELEAETAAEIAAESGGELGADLGAEPGAEPGAVREPACAWAAGPGAARAPSGEPHPGAGQERGGAANRAPARHRGRAAPGAGRRTAAPGVPPTRPAPGAAAWGPDGALDADGIDALAGRVASALAAAGLGPGDRVGLSLRRGAALPAALMGALRAGVAFVPVDPDGPPARAAALLRATRAALVIQDDAAPRADGLRALSMTALRAAQGTANGLSVGLGEEPPGAPPPAGPARRPAPDDLAYILHTSGSTGAPKGVAVPRRAMAALFAAMDAALPTRPDAVHLALSPATFDVALWELLGPLRAGARVVIPDAAALRDPETLVELIRRHAVTDLHATPTALRMLDAVGLPAGLRIASTGEALPGALAARLLGRAARLVNLYGPTETTIWATMRRVTMADAARAVVPIGRPLPGCEARILDPDGARVPPGMVGELHLGGPTLADGYDGRPELTAEAFVADPERPGARLYRTGDLVRRLPDGGIAYLGRRDRQAKLRGHRIEPAEIERALEALPGVAAALAAPADLDGDPTLVAAVVPSDPARPPDPGALDAALRARLPAWMVPQRIRIAPSIPRTASGKADVAALLAAETTGAAAAGAPEPTADDGDAAVIARIWRTLTGAPPASPRAGFLTSGGSSIQVLRLMAAIDEAFGTRPPLAEFFRDPTPEGLLRHVRMAAGVRPRAPAAPRRDAAEVATVQTGAPGRAPLVLTPGLRGDGRYALNLLPELPPDLPVLELRLETARAGRPEEIADRAARALEAHLPPGAPAHVAGYSFAARTAWSLGFALLRGGRAPGVLGILDIAAFPQLPASPPAVPAAAPDARAQRRAAGELRVDAPWPGDLLHVLMRGPPEISHLAPDGGWSALTDGRFASVDLIGRHLDLVEDPTLARAAMRGLADAIARREALGPAAPRPLPPGTARARAARLAAFAAARVGPEALLDAHLAALTGGERAGAPTGADAGPPEAWALFQIRRLALMLGRRDAAAAAADGPALRGLEGSSDDPALLLALSRLLLETGRAPRARVAAQRAAEAAPDWPIARLQFARTLHRTGRSEAAARAAREALALQPWAPWTAHEAAALLLLTGAPREAAALCAWLVEARPRMIQAWNVLIRALRADGDRAAADRALAEALRRAPDSPLLAALRGAPPPPGPRPEVSAPPPSSP